MVVVGWVYLDRGFILEKPMSEGGLWVVSVGCCTVHMVRYCSCTGCSSGMGLAFFSFLFPSVDPAQRA